MVFTSNSFLLDITIQPYPYRNTYFDGQHGGTEIPVLARHYTEEHNHDNVLMPELVSLNLTGDMSGETKLMLRAIK